MFYCDAMMCFVLDSGMMIYKVNIITTTTTTIVLQSTMHRPLMPLFIIFIFIILHSMHGFLDIFATGFDHNVVNMQHV